jgi:hypothetical protein
MTRQCGAPPARQNPKTIVKMSREFPHAEDIDARRRQLERQRHAVEPAANLQNRRHVGVVEGEAVNCRHGPLVEQLNGRIP